MYITLLLGNVMVLFPAALEIPEVVPTADEQGEGEDKEWQTWLQDLFCCGELILRVEWALYKLNLGDTITFENSQAIVILSIGPILST